MQEYGVGTTWTVRDIVILVRSLSDRTTRSCVFSHSSVRTGYTVHIRYARIKQRSSCTSRVRQWQLASPAGNMRINRRKIYTRNANIRARTRVLFGPQCYVKSMFFSSVWSFCFVTSEYFHSKTNRIPFESKALLLCFYISYIFIFLQCIRYFDSCNFTFIEINVICICFKLENVNRKAQCFQYNQLKGIKLKLTKTVW